MSKASFAVTVDPLRCEGERECIKVCPASVFELSAPSAELGWFKRIKVAFHGGQQAFAVKSEACIGCMACVRICPDRAITVSAITVSGSFV